MNREPLDVIPVWGLFLASCGLIWLALEAGYRLGRSRQSHAAEEKESSVGAMVGSILGLLAFLLAFTFGMAASRFEDRRQTLLQEANAIGTTYLRARMLPEAQRIESVKLLREYVDVRVRGVYEGVFEAAIARSEALHEMMWAQAVAATAKRDSPSTGLYVQALSELIDLHAKRIHVGLRSRIPIIIWAGLFLLALLGMGAIGYQAGLAATRRSPAMFALMLAFAGVLYLIADLDRPGEGLLHVSRQALIDVQKTMQADKS